MNRKKANKIINLLMEKGIDSPEKVTELLNSKLTFMENNKKFINIVNETTDILQEAKDLKSGKIKPEEILKEEKKEEKEEMKRTKKKISFIDVFNKVNQEEDEKFSKRMENFFKAKDEIIKNTTKVFMNNESVSDVTFDNVTISYRPIMMVNHLGIYEKVKNVFDVFVCGRLKVSFAQHEGMFYEIIPSGVDRRSAAMEPMLLPIDKFIDKIDSEYNK